MQTTIIDHKKSVTGGMLLLALGAVFYLVTRPADSVYFIPDNFSGFQLLSDELAGFANSLPSFLHVTAFCMLTAGVLQTTREQLWRVCVSWTFIDVLFEIAQHTDVSTILIGNLPVWFSRVPVLENTAGYLFYGIFDWFDCIAIFAGAVFAYLVLLTLNKQKLPIKIREEI